MGKMKIFNVMVKFKGTKGQPVVSIHSVYRTQARAERKAQKLSRKGGLVAWVEEDDFNFGEPGKDPGQKQLSLIF